MKVLKALLAVLTTLAVALTAILLLWQDKSAPRYIKIYETSSNIFLAKQHPGQAVKPPGRGVFALSGRPHKNAADFPSAAFAHIQ